MIFQQNHKKYVMISQTAATNGATITGTYVDCAGYDYIKIDVIGTTSNNATNKPATLRITESDDTNATNFAAVTALVGGGAGGFTIPSAPTATTTAPYASFNVDLRYRKRYLNIEISPVMTQTYTALATLGRAEQSPVGTTNENVAVSVYG